MEQQPKKRNWWKILVLTIVGGGVLLVGGCSVLVAGIAVIGASSEAPSEAPKTPQVQQDSPKNTPQKPDAPQQAKPAPQSKEQGGGDYLEVSGTPGIPFSCAVMDGDGQQRTVDGKTPTKIPLKDMGGWTASSFNSCQKSGASGTLEVAIVVGGETKSSNSTSAAYGIADANYPQ